jgi:single stranded DNA-binding protein
LNSHPTPRPPQGGSEESKQKDQFSAARTDAAGSSDEEFIMAFVRVEQRNAHLAGGVRLHTVEGRDGPVSKATLTAISNTRRGSGDNRGEEATAIQWTLWGKQAENAAQYLGKGSHINVVGRVQNNNYERDGETVYTMAFTAEEIDYLDTKAEGEALRGKQVPGAQEAQPAPEPAKAARSRKASAKAPTADAADDVPF